MFLRNHYFRLFVRKTIPVEILDEVPLRFTIFTLRHGVLQIDFICKTQLVRQLARLPTFCYDGKVHESIPFVDFS